MARLSHAAVHAALVAFMALFTTPALTASFDCSKARTAREKAICADVALSQDDTNLDATYTDDLRLLSDAGRVALRDEERAWLRSLDQSCLPPNGARSTSVDRRYTACLREANDERSRQLSGAAFIAGPYVFRLVHANAVLHAPDAKGLSFGFGVSVSYPHVDGTTDPALNAWNASVVRTPEEEGRCGTGVTAAAYRVTVAFATATAIATHVRDVRLGCPITSFRGQVVEGLAASGDIDRITVLRPSYRQLEGTSLFRSDTNWRSFLSAQVVSGLRSAAAAFRCDPNSIPDTARFAEDPARWRFSKIGLFIAFARGDLGAGCRMPTTPTITWNDLKPYLNTAFGAPPTQLDRSIPPRSHGL